MYTIPGIEGGNNVQLGRCINVETKRFGPDIFNLEVFRTEEINARLYGYKQVGKIGGSGGAASTRPLNVPILSLCHFNLPGV